jgi:beta-glucanase (GH16 family)
MKLSILAKLVFLFGIQAHAENWKLIWADEFNQPGLPDPAHWTNELGFIRNHESQFYTVARPENARVTNGVLVIEARKEQFPNLNHKSGSKTQPEFAQYTSASLKTKNLAEWQYGRIEVRAQLPRGRGVWPAIWMLGANESQVGWPRCGEIDIMEYVGFEPDTIHANIHTGKYNHNKKNGKGSTLKLPQPFESFHNYSIEWSPEKIDFFVDDFKYFTYAREESAGQDAWPFDQKCYLILNLAIGGEWGGMHGIDDSIFPQRFEIDYVRVYQSADQR